MKLPKNPLVVYSSFVAASAVIVLGGMLASSSEPDSAVFLGMSIPRLVVALGLFIAAIVLFGIMIRAAKDWGWAERVLDEWFGMGRFSGAVGWLGGISFGLGWAGIFLPSYRVGWLGNYWLRIQPVMLFILLTGIATLTLLYVQRRKSVFVDQSNSGILRLSVILFLVCLLVLTGMLFSGFGIHAQDDFWYAAGVPVLGEQLIGAIAGGVLFLQIEKRGNLRRLDLFAFILIFVVTAFLWVREPLLAGFSFVSYPPNNVLYPLFDPVLFDVASQLPLIGQEIQIFGGYFFERPLYLVFLFYMHSFFGQNYEVLMAWQAGIYAIFPVLIYLIGRSLNFRVVGFAAALVAMFRGVNSIAASNMIDLANPKMMLTDFPAAIGVALVVLVICEWLKQPGGKWHHALWLGGALGFTLMLRTNALILLALIPLYALLRLFKDWKTWLLHSSLIVLAVIAITLPWELRNRSFGGQMYAPIISKFKAVIDTRYTSPPTPQLPVNQSLLVLSTLYHGNEVIQSDAVCDSVACFVPNHFLHNIVTSVLILPTSPVMDDLRVTTRDNYPYWYPLWDGKFTLPTLLLFILNVFLIVLGISVAWKKAHLPGLAPFAIFLFYDLSNAFARTSGGRYVVPMDWIVTIYFLLGILQLIVWILKTTGSNWDFEPASPSRSITRPETASRILPKVSFILFILLGFGSLLPLSENLYADRYKDFDPGQTLVENEQSLETAGLDIRSIESFLQNKGAAILVGRALFPRHYRINEGHTYFYPNLPLPFPRLTFNLIGPAGQQGVILPGDVPRHFPHAGDVIVIGCSERDHLDALAVIILDESNAIYTRSPESELTCPLQQPVCNNNSVCR